PKSAHAPVLVTLQTLDYGTYHTSKSSALIADYDQPTIILRSSTIYDLRLFDYTTHLTCHRLLCAIFEPTP
ncbi:hypothetical protein V496_03056, partial [Pseudogymnoascus sp. VKM F-4515 (FW-2607)]